MFQIQWESKEQHILKCKIVNENDTIDNWNPCDQNQNNELEKKVEQLAKVVKYFYYIV